MENRKLAFFEKKLMVVENSLTKSDRKIADYICLNPEDFTHLSITDISKNVPTNIAAITRFAKKMGYEKLKDLKLEIARELEIFKNSKYQKQYANIDKDDNVLTISQKVLRQNMEAIWDIEKMLRQEELEIAIKIMQNAGRLIFVGLGGSSSVAQDAYHKFRRLGLMVELVTDVQVQGIVSSVGNEKDVIIVVSNEGANTELNIALRIAKENKMKIIAITQFSKSPLTKLADVCLYTLSREFSNKPEALISRIAEYSLIDVLYVSYCMQSQEELEEKMLRISGNLKLFKNYDY